MKNIRFPTIIRGHFGKQALIFLVTVLILLPIISVYAREAPPRFSHLSIAQQAVGDPTITLSSPERGRQLNTPNVLFQWSASGNTTGITYHIVVLEGTDPEAVIQEANTSNNNITFRLFDDTYSWYVEAIDATGNVTGVSDTRWFQVLLEDSAPPEVTVTSPNGGEEIPGGSVFAITWAIVEDLTSIPDLKIDIYLSTDGAASWQSIASNQSNNGAFAWQVPNINTTLALIKVTATDEDQKIGLDVSDTVFTILGATP